MTTKAWCEALILAILLALFDWKWAVLAFGVMWYVNAQLQEINRHYPKEKKCDPESSPNPPSP